MTLSTKVKLGLLIGLSVFSLAILLSLLYFIFKWYLGRKKTVERDKRGTFVMLKDSKSKEEEPKHFFGVEKQYLFREGSFRSLESRSTGPSPPPMYDEDLRKLRVGKFEFTPTYYHHKRKLQVVIRRVTCYPLYQTLQTSAYLYVVAFLLPDRADYFESELQQISEDNLIDEMCEFVVSYDDLENRLLKFEIHVCDRFSRHRVVGERCFMLRKRTIAEHTETSFEKIDFEECLTTDESRIGGVMDTKMASEILFSLCYMPTSGRLTFVALKGKNLFLKDKQPGDVFLRVSLIQGNRTVKTVQTNTARKSTSPVYNEAFVFQVAVEKIKEATAVVKVIAAKGGQPEQLIGRVVVGTNAGSNLGRKHWEAMLFTARKPVAHWHPISA